MKVLYFSPRALAPVTGADLRDYHLVRQIAKYARVTFLGIRGQDGEAAASPSPPVCEQVVLVQRQRAYTAPKIISGFVGPVPLTVLNYHDRAVEEALRRLLAEGKFDLVQIEGVHLSQYVGVIAATRPRPVLVCDWHNVESELMSRYAERTASWARKLYARRTAQLLLQAERELLDKCDAHLVVSERDRCRLLQVAPHARVEVVENGVDVVQLRKPQAGLPSETANRRANLIFVGSMDFHANIDAVTYFATDVWPHIYRQVPEMQFEIVGSNPTPEVRNLATLPGITVTGTVADVAPYYGAAFAAVVPLRIGGGTRLKILEAMAAGVPVISTQLGAEGLPVEQGRHLLVADSPEEMVHSLLQLRESPGLWQQLSRAGWELVCSRYDWPVVGERLNRVYGSLLAQGARS